MKKLLFLVVLISLLSVVSGANTLECQFRNDSCLTDSGEVAFLYANKHFFDASGKILSSHISTEYDGNYSKVLCCKSPFGQLDVSFQNSGTECVNGDELMYFANDESNSVKINNKLRFKEFEKMDNTHILQNFNLNDYNQKSCVVKPDEFSLFDIVASDRDYSVAGYTCMYRISDLENGLVSDCDATFGTGNQYKFAVWGRLWEDVSSLKCNLDCTSKLDGRVYSACSTQIKECRGIPSACDGALLNSWVPEINSTGSLTGNELLCAPPWNVVRSKLFTTDSIEIKSEDGKCENLISKSYPVVLGNNQVNMRIYVCGD